MITIKAIDILKENNKFTVRDIHNDEIEGERYETYDVAYSEPQALTSANRRASLLKVPNRGITEVIT